MSEVKGRYIVLEGGEGVGKTTQIDLLVQALEALKIPVRVMREPGSAPFAKKLRKILKSGPKRSPKANLLAFNAARADSIEQVRSTLKEGTWVLSDRSYISTIVYQGYGESLPLSDVRFVCELTIGDTKPDLTLILDADPEIIQDRLADRDNHDDYFENLDLGFHQKIRQGYLEEAARLGLPVVDAYLSEQQVHEKIWKHLQQKLPKELLPRQVKAQDKSLGHSTTNPLVVKDDNGQFRITPRGNEFLAEAVTNTESNVYAFTDKLSNVTIAAAMARLSRRSDDMRITILDEFATAEGKDEDLLKRVITAYGDDSVQQLTGLHLVVEGASNLLTKKLEWGRLAAYLEQSTRYIFFDQKDSRGNYKYYTPPSLSAPVAQKYEQKINDIFDIYSQMVHQLTEYVRHNSKTPGKEQDGAWKAATRAQACDAARPVLPVATKATVGIFASGQALESLIIHLQSDQLEEAKQTGEKILKESRKVIPAFLERADKPNRGGAATAYRAATFEKTRQFAVKHLPQSLSSDNTDSVSLVSYTPKNELDLVPHILYEHSNLAFAQIEREVANWSYERKVETMSRYIGERLNRRHKPGRAFEQAHYSWDLICDYGIFRDLQRHRMVDDLRWQELSPRYGYEMPGLIEQAGLDEMFEKCFDISYELYSDLQKHGYSLEAQYVTLLGHRMRWKVMYNAREAFHLHELRTSPQGHPGYRKLVQQMHAKLSEAHPLIGAAMKFVNKGEDPELTRLAAERYTQFKLKQLK